MSPTFGVAIGLGYVESAFAEEGTSVGVEIRDRTVGATVVPHRFLRHRRN
jgi:aminomethyltransferase